MPKQTVVYKTSSPSGDLISFLGGIRQIWKETKKKGVVCHRLGMIGGSYEGAEQPYGNEQGLPICFNQYCFDMMRPLLLAQPYIEDYAVFEGEEEVEMDLDKIRMEVFTNQPKGALNAWPGYAFPQMAFNLADIWLKVPFKKKYKDKIIINYTERNRNYFIHYNTLKKHQDKLIFAGLQKEKDSFCDEWKLNIPLLEVKDFYELASIIKSCKFLLGNQSFVMQLAEATKAPRILECFPMMPTHVLVGKNAFGYYHQPHFEYFFNKLLNKQHEKLPHTNKWRNR